MHIGEITDTDDFRPWIRLWAPNGAHPGLARPVLDAAAIDGVVAPVTGTYLVLVASFDSGFDGTGTYRLTMAHTPGPITVSPGDEGGPLTNGAIHTGEIVQGDLDVWTFTATAGDRIAVHIGETFGDRRLPSLDSSLGAQPVPPSAALPDSTRRRSPTLSPRSPGLIWCW